MQFTRLWPSIFLLAIPGLILLYMLKKQNKKKQVSSIFLWQKIYETSYADKPWQKLRNHLLLWLQILGILLFTAALMMPHIPWGKGYYKNTIFVIDCSASMAILNHEETRYEAATRWVSDYLSQTKEKTKSYMITVADHATLTVAGSEKKDTILTAMKKAIPTYQVAHMDEGIQMAKSLGESLKEDYEIIILSDQKISYVSGNIRQVWFGNSGCNGAISLMASSNNNDQKTILVQVVNKGNVSFKSDVSLYGEEALIDVQELSLDVGQRKTLHFILNTEDKAKDYAYFKSELAIKDGVEADNTYYYISEAQQRKKILLVTESNLFLEKALMTLEDCDIYKTTDLHLLEEPYDLYVIDRQEIKALPSKGNLLCIDCELPNLVEETSYSGSKQVKVAEDGVPDYLKKLSFTVTNYRTYSQCYWGKSLLTYDNEALAILGEKEGQKIGLIGFDLWQSDFVLKPEFPLFIGYLAENLLDTRCIERCNVTSSSEVKIRTKSIHEMIKVKMPSGAIIELPEPCIKPIQELGIYEINIAYEEKPTNLAVNYPVNNESDMSEELLGEEQVTYQISKHKGDKDLTPYCTMCLLGIVLLEWYFYRKGY